MKEGMVVEVKENIFCEFLQPKIISAEAVGTNQQRDLFSIAKKHNRPVVKREGDAGPQSSSHFNIIERACSHSAELRADRITTSQHVYGSYLVVVVVLSQ